MDLSQVTLQQQYALSGQTYINSSGQLVNGTMPHLTNSTTIDFASDNATPVIEADAVFHSVNTDNVARLCFRYSGDPGYITTNTLFGYPMSSYAGGRITPTTSDQTIINSNTYVSDIVTVTGDSNLNTNNIRYGTQIFGVGGSVHEYRYHSGTISTVGIMTFTDISGNNYRMPYLDFNPSSYGFGAVYMFVSLVAADAKYCTFVAGGQIVIRRTNINYMDTY